MKIEGHTFLVTGGASGLGLATVRDLLSKGGNVVIADLNEDDGAKLAQELGDCVRFAKCNVTDEASVQAAIDMAVATFGSLHGAISCAGVGMACRTASAKRVHPLDVFERVIAINAVGTFNVCRLAAKAMLAQDPVTEDGERGVLVNTASVAAFDGQVGQVAYAASKGAVVSMNLVLARDLGRYGIRACVVAPGPFLTPLMQAAPEKVINHLLKSASFPTSRLGHPKEFASLVSHIVTNSMMNGETVRLDGGIRMPAM